MYNKFNVLEWLNAFYYNTTNFNDEKINAVRDFSLLWSLFESELGKKNINVHILSKIAATIYKKCKRPDFFIEYLEYFQQRYLDKDKNINSLFEQLLFHNFDKKQLVINVLKQTEHNPVKIIEALLLIVYRLRNNLFHGEKELHSINTQYLNFNNANKLLAEIIIINKNAT